MTDDGQARLDEARAKLLESVAPVEKPNGAPHRDDDGMSASLRLKIGKPIPANKDEELLRQQWANHVAQRYADTAARTYPVELPSGLKVNAKRANIVLLMRFGRIPDAITPVVSWMIEEIEAGGVARLNRSVNKREEDPIDRLKLHQEMIALFDYLWILCVVSPVFTDKLTEIDEHTFYIGDVDLRDKEFFYQWSQGVDVNVREFRGEESTAAVGDAPAGGEDRSSAE